MAETLGSLVDKICIAELKLYHMREQTERPDATPAFREQCRERLRILERQRSDLATELTILASLWSQGRWTPKVYRQFKLYNDPQYRPKSESARVL